ncbi:AMP-binding protein [Bradyrhizobium diazoefficiens]|nr:AMP-binding protein [Bradyrhizobium diazoefficiens]QQO23724.1 AMP-binding protein [Bradyrhizobium diazoefficiens]
MSSAAEGRYIQSNSERAPSSTTEFPLQIISELVRARAKDSAARVFCSFQGTDTTYIQLERRAMEFAGALIGAGVQPGDRVGLMLGQSVEHIELFLAIAWIGAIVVPFSVHLKSAGLELQLSSAKPRVMVANRLHADSIRAALSTVEQSATIVWFEDGADSAGEFHLDGLLRASRAVVTPVTRTLDDPVAIMYTSGTTGAPKGAVGSERYYWVGAKSTGIISDAHRDDVFHFWEPFYHGSAWFVIMLALHKGLKLHMVERFSASRLWDQVREAGATKLHYLGGLANIILAQQPTASERDNPVSIAWGAACPPDAWRKFEERFQLIVREGYGLTEAGMFSHINLRGVLGSMGTPIDELQSWIADEHGNRVGPGVVGELVLRPQLATQTMTCYWNEPQKTAEVIRDGCIYTGDLAMVDEEGNYFFKGRKKDAMRRRGENISAWEVERVVNAAPGVEESAVIGVDSELGEQEIMALVKLREGAEPDPFSLIKFCAERLAYYQVPRFIQFVDEFPRGPSQRIVKREIKVDLANAFDAEKAGIKPTRAL